MAWLAALGTLLQLIFIVIQRWFAMSDEKKAKVQLMLKDVKDVKTSSDITRMFDTIHRL